jgi:cysteine desulfurase
MLLARCVCATKHDIFYMNNMSAYFDYISSTPLDPRVLDAMLPYLTRFHGNPLSPHKLGREAAKALDDAREKVAAFIGASPEEIIFTSGEVESNNLAIKGLLTVHENGQLLASAVEPLSILRPAESLEKWGFSLSLIPVDANGQVRLLSLEKLINNFTRVASVSWVVAETGAVQPIEAIADQVKEASSVPFHCNASVAARLFPVNVRDLNVDALTISSDLLGGPMAVGALYLRHGVRLQPLLDGSPQEGGRRSGRENLPGIVGFARAIELALSERQDRFNKLKRLDGHLKNRLKEIPELVIHSDLPSRVPGILSCRIDGLEAEALLTHLDQAEIYATADSPCASMIGKPSHVLKAMGLSDEQTASSLNFSLSWDTKESDIDDMIAVLKQSVAQLKTLSY